MLVGFVAPEQGGPFMQNMRLCCTAHALPDVLCTHAYRCHVSRPSVSTAPRNCSDSALGATCGGKISRCPLKCEFCMSFLDGCRYVFDPFLAYASSKAHNNLLCQLRTNAANELRHTPFESSRVQKTPSVPGQEILFHPRQR